MLFQGLQQFQDAVMEAAREGVELERVVQPERPPAPPEPEDASEPMTQKIVQQQIQMKKPQTIYFVMKPGKAFYAMCDTRENAEVVARALTKAGHP